MLFAESQVVSFDVMTLLKNGSNFCMIVSQSDNILATKMQWDLWYCLINKYDHILIFFMKMPILKFSKTKWNLHTVDSYCLYQNEVHSFYKFCMSRFNA